MSEKILPIRTLIKVANAFQVAISDLSARRRPNRFSGTGNLMDQALFATPVTPSAGRHGARSDTPRSTAALPPFRTTSRGSFFGITQGRCSNRRLSQHGGPPQASVDRNVAARSRRTQKASIKRNTKPQLFETEVLENRQFPVLLGNCLGRRGSQP